MVRSPPIPGISDVGFEDGATERRPTLHTQIQIRRRRVVPRQWPDHGIGVAGDVEKQEQRADTMADNGWSHESVNRYGQQRPAEDVKRSQSNGI